MDNLSAHLDKIREMIAVGKTVYLPLYSSDFNPIENCWSKQFYGRLQLVPAKHLYLEVALHQGLCPPQ